MDIPDMLPEGIGAGTVRCDVRRLVMPETLLASQQLDRSDRHHRGAGSRPLLQDSQIPLDTLDGDGLPDEDERLWIRIDPGIAVHVVHQCGVRDDLLRGAAPGLRNPDIDALAWFQRMAGGVRRVVLRLGGLLRRRPDGLGPRRDRPRLAY